jgi:hypothetical protein
MRAAHSAWIALSGFAVFAIGATACSDPPPPIPSGAFAVQFSQLGGTCNIGSHKVELGVVGETGSPTLVKDGKDGAEVECSVQKSGGGFQIEIGLSGAGATIQIGVPSIAADATVDAPATGTFLFQSQQTSGDALSTVGTPCEFYFVPDSGQTVEAGSVWMTFRCAAIEGEGDTCGISDSYVNVADCTGAVVEEE